MAYIEKTTCCGVDEISSIQGSSPVGILTDVGGDRYDDGNSNGAFYTFTDTNRHNYGKNLAKYIHDNKLGKVTKMPNKKNPNTGNTIQLFIWALNGPAFKRWYRARHPLEDWQH